MTVPADETSKGAAARLAALDTSTERFREATDSLRLRADTSAKAIGGLGLTVVTAIGVTKIGDLYPLPRDVSWLDALACLGVVVGFAAMAASVLLFSRKLWTAQRPLLLGSDLQAPTTDLEGDERQLAERVYDAFWPGPEGTPRSRSTRPRASASPRSPGDAPVRSGRSCSSASTSSRARSEPQWLEPASGSSASA